MYDKRQLLCTFSTLLSFKIMIDEIKNFYSVYNNRFFIFTNLNTPKDVFITYNIISEGKEIPKFPNTISIHRKKQSGTLFTLNSMNQLIKDENNGIFDKEFSVNWNLYTNSLIITGYPSIRILPIKLLEIVNL